MGVLFFAAATVLGTVAQDSLDLVVRDQVDLIEVNHFFDGNILRQVEAPDIRETWTQHDPEVTNRKFLPRSFRHTFRRDNNLGLLGD